MKKLTSMIAISLIALTSAPALAAATALSNSDIASVGYVNAKVGTAQPKSNKANQLGGANGTWTDAGALATKSKISTSDLDTGVLTTSVTAESTDSQLPSAAAVWAVASAASGAQETADGKQTKSTKDYQLGNKDGGWIDAGALATKSKISTSDLDTGVLATTISDSSTDAQLPSAAAVYTATNAAAVAASGAQETADGKQTKSTKDYQLGNKDGGWTDAGALATKSKISTSDLDTGVLTTSVTAESTDSQLPSAAAVWAVASAASGAQETADGKINKMTQNNENSGKAVMATSDGTSVTVVSVPDKPTQCSQTNKYNCFLQVDENGKYAWQFVWLAGAAE